MRNATLERQGYLDTLGDSLNNVSVSAGNYLSSARNTAVSFFFVILLFSSERGQKGGRGDDGLVIAVRLIFQMKEAAKGTAKGLFGKLL